jgi:hypothetical protein
VGSSRVRLRQGVIPVVAVVAICGYLLGSRGGSSPSTSASGTLEVLSGTNLLLEYPPGWQPAASVPDLAGLKITGARILAPGGKSSIAGLVSGRFPADEASPLPAAFLALVHGPPQVEVVNLTHAQAYRFGHVRGYERTLDVYAIPAVGGIQTALVCYAASSAIAYLKQCEEIVATVSLVGLTPFDLSPNEAYANKLAALIEGLDAERLTLRREIRSSTAPERLSALASALARRFAAAVNSLTLFEAPQAASAAQAALVSAMQDARRGYGELSSAAAAEDSSAYGEADQNVQTAEARVDAALRNFALLGYDHT